MKRHIPSDFINQIISSSDIIEVISRFITLKKRGSSHIACCPFHHEKTPSFTVSQSKQIYHCFGCGVGGNVITFLKDYENLSFIETIEELAQINGLSIPYETTQNNLELDSSLTDKQAILNCLADVQKLFSWNLKHHVDKNDPINYLKERGISGETAKIFKIGFSPNEWHSLANQFSKKYSINILSKAGLVIQKNHATYDRFRNRITFPIKNRKGQIIGFGGRIFHNESNQPKYLNSPETAVFHKGQELYGLHEAKQKQQKLQEILIVEGYMDVISLHQFGYYSCVATLGTALTIEHLKVLFRECSLLVFCFDGDQAGLQASMRTIKLVIPLLNDVKTAKFLTLPQGQDPDSLIQQEGLENFKNRISQASTTAEFIIDQLQNQYDLHTADGQAKAIMQLQSTLPNTQNVFSQTTLNLFQQKSQLSQTQIKNLFQSKLTSNNDLHKQIHFSKIDLSKLTLTHKILQYIFLAPQLTESLDVQFLKEYRSQNTELLLDAIKMASHYKNTAILLESLNEKYPSHEKLLYRLAAINPELSEKEIEIELFASLEALRKYYQQKKLDYLVEKSKLYSLSEQEKQELVNLLHKTDI